MNFNRHSNLEGQHAFLGASRYHWIGYDNDKLLDSYNKFRASLRGTELHALACECIRLGINLPNNKQPLSAYVNDAIGFKMTPEQPLFYSVNCYGTADSICFRNKMLRIHDLKTGETPGDIRQLMIYAALFCLEYDYKPTDIKTELRIYQFDPILVDRPDPADIQAIMHKIVEFDKLIEQRKLEG